MSRGNKTYVDGVAYTRARLAKISREADKPIKKSFEKIAQMLVDDAKARVPSKTGDLRNSIEASFSPDGLGVVVGPAAKSRVVQKASKYGNLNKEKVAWNSIKKRSKDAAWQATKAYWVEFGTKGHKVRVQIKKTLAANSKFYGKEVNIPAQSPRPFINPAWETHKAQIIPQIEAEFKALVRSAANGS
jgi:HK97 gp10 family phage protein